MSISFSIPTWVLWVLGIPLGIIVLFFVFLGAVFFLVI